MEDVRPYKTSDTPLATYLLAKGMKMVGLIQHKTDEKRKVFVFADAPERDGLVEEFLTGNDLISASHFSRVSRQVMRRLHE